MTRDRMASRWTASSLTLLVIFAVGAVLRCYRLGQNSLWIDEIASLETARERFWTIPAAALRQDAFEPPLYFLLLHIVAGHFGDGETALRVASAISGTLTIPLVWFLVWELSRERQVATLAATFLALNPLHLWYSQEARPYALMMFFGTAALVALARALRQPSRRLWAAFAICSALAMMTHAVGCLVPAVAALWVLLRPDRAKTLRPLLVASGAILLLVAPVYIPLARAIVGATGTGSPERPLTGLELPYTAFTYVGGFSFGPSAREIQNNGWQMAAAEHTVQLGLAAALLVLWLVLAVVNRSPVVTLLLVLCTLPAVLTFIGSAATAKAYNVRYTVLGVIGFVASLSAVIRPLRPSRRTVLMAIFCTVFLWADAQWFFTPRFWKDDSRAAVAWLSAHLQPGAVVAVAPGYVTGTLAHYAARSGAGLCLVGVADESSLPTDRTPDALVLTRLHHVSQWRELESEFLRLAGSSLERGTAVGYTLLVRRPSRPPATSTSVAPGC